ncbi:MAG: glycosyltransferase family 2 protein [Gammaproteobacteria bacterium]|nr:glycosyltransferase family 2 protein [Gammaproteobacteria bacterium]
MNSLVSIGLLTFNRPEGLKKALEAILNQTYQNLEIIVADNCSENPKVSEMVNQYAMQDNRIKYCRHTRNLGSGFNGRFAISHATGDYYMFAADDDYFISDNLIEELMKHAHEHVLCFSDHETSFGANDNMKNVYGHCETKLDYFYALLNHGGGTPVYGLYNRKLMAEIGLNFSFENDLEYYTEGSMLYKIFLTGLVKFVPNVYIYFDRNSKKPEPLKMCYSFIEAYDRNINVIMNSDLDNVDKKNAMQIIHAHNSAYFYGLFKNLNPYDQQQVFYKILEKGYIRL